MNENSFRGTMTVIKADALRMAMHSSFKQKVALIIRCIIDSKFGIIFWFRISHYLFLKRSIFAKLLYIPVFIVYRILQHWTGVQIPVKANIKGGMKIIHFSDVVIVDECTIGKNLTISQGVTIGRGFSKKNYGCPSIGDNVIIFAGTKVFGNITIGDNVIIGANSVVLTDVPSNSVVAGNPARVLSTTVEDAIVETWQPFFYGYT